jgi:hypothetical protein
LLLCDNGLNGLQPLLQDAQVKSANLSVGPPKKHKEMHHFDSFWWAGWGPLTPGLGLGRPNPCEFQSRVGTRTVGLQPSLGCNRPWVAPLALEGCSAWKHICRSAYGNTCPGCILFCTRSRKMPPQAQLKR